MSDTCVFCDIIAGTTSRPRHYNPLGSDSIVFEPRHPVTPGHLLVVPNRHVRDAAEDPNTTAVAMRAAAVLAGRFTSANIITSIGEPATQSIFHLHLHIVPRRPGDGLALPWTGQPVGGAR